MEQRLVQGSSQQVQESTKACTCQNRLPCQSPRHKILHPGRIIREVIIKTGCLCKIEDLLQTRVKYEEQERIRGPVKKIIPSQLWCGTSYAIQFPPKALQFLFCCAWRCWELKQRPWEQRGRDGQAQAKRKAHQQVRMQEASVHEFKGVVRLL